MLPSRSSAPRLILVERRDTVAVRDPGDAHVRRYRLARMQAGGRTGARVPARLPAPSRIV